MIDTEEYFRQVVAYVHLNPLAAGLVDDPARHLFSGHRELIGICQPHVVDLQATFRSFGTTGTLRPAEDYLLWIREVAEARWVSQDVSDLPWWESARNDEEIASLDRHPTATTFDGRVLCEDRAELELEEFARRLVPASGHSLEDLSSRRRGRELTRGRIEFATLAVGRYGLRVCDVAALLNKHPNSVTKWLNCGLRVERDHPAFKSRLDQLDAAISRHP